MLFKRFQLKVHKRIMRWVVPGQVPMGSSNKNNMAEGFDFQPCGWIGNAFGFVKQVLNERIYQHLFVIYSLWWYTVWEWMCLIN